MKITLIRPAVMSGVARDALEPLVFAILAGLTPPDVEQVLYDQRIETIPFDEPTDLVALSVETFTAKSAYQVAAQYRRRGVPVVMGGCHPTLLPQESLRFADAVVVGDAEGVWAELVADARKGNLKQIYRGDFLPLDGLKPDRHIFQGKRYLPASLVQFGRGCRFACDFCCVHAFYGSNLRQRPVDEVIAEIESTGRRFIIFTDDNLFANFPAARALVNALASRKVRWACQASLDLAQDEELVRLMARSGCLCVTIGFESLNKANLKQMGKAWNAVQGDYRDLVRVFHRNGIMVYGAFVFGYDHDTPDSFTESLDFALDTKLCTANFNPLWPVPGTPLYERLHREGRLINDPWWLHPDYRYGDGMFHPRGMTVGQLASNCYRVRTEFNRPMNILRRALNFRANCRSWDNAYIYFVANLVNQREIHRKQGRVLGGGSEPLPLPGSESR